MVMFSFLFVVSLAGIWVTPPYNYVLCCKLAGQDSPRRRISGSLYETRMSACLLFQQPAFIDPTCSSLGRLSDLEKFGGTDCNPVAMHGSL